jgi:archaeosine-15-forming tRNA-guanine transglycosylase
MPTQTNPKLYHLSASSIGAFKACPQRFRLGYREGIRVVEDTDSQRQGTNWHAMHECYANTEAAFGKEHALDTVVNLLNERYVQCPAHKTVTEWALERQILLTCFVGYLWYFQDDPVEYLASEVPFNLPIHNAIGLPLPMDEVQRVGKMDHIIKWQGMVGTHERKSTTRSIAPDSDYWDKAKKDTQVSMYAAALRDMQYVGPDGVTWIRHAENEVLLDLGKVVRFGNTLYDVWHKPTIQPKVLSQKDTAEFIASGKYFDQEFQVAWTEAVKPGDSAIVSVDEEAAEVEMGKKGFAIRETVAMYGARLLADIYERPDFYYVRREISRTDQDIKKFRHELYNIYQAQKMFSKNDFWFENESQCRATFPCPFIPICYGPGADAVCDGKTTPNGFKRIFVDLTVNGNVIPEE